MAPTLTDYLRGLRRLWWLPLTTVLVGVGMGVWAASVARPPAVTFSNALFTFQIEAAGDDSAGSARGAETEVAQARLTGYVTLARTSRQVREILANASIETPPTMFSSIGGFKDSTARALIGVDETGIVEVRVKNSSLTQARADQLVLSLSREIVRQALAIDSQQVTPSLRPDPLITEPQATEEPASRTTKIALPVLLLVTIGLGLVYLLVWRQGLIYARRDIEERLGVRVLGDLGGHPADAPALALALVKGRGTGTTALVVPASLTPSDQAVPVGAAVAAGGRELGLAVTFAAVGPATAAQKSTARTSGPTDAPAASPFPADALNLIDAHAGIDARALRAATSADVVALVVEYGRTSYRDLTAAGRTLAEVTGAEIAIIGLHSKSRS